MKKFFLTAIAFAVIITISVPAMAQRNTKTSDSQQLLSVGGSAVWRTGELGWSSSLSYVNFEESSHLLWGGEFEFGCSNGFTLPAAYIAGGAHVSFGHVRLYAAPRIGVSSIRVYSRLSNDYFTRETSKRQFTLTVGGQLGVQYQGDALGIGIVASYGHNIFRPLNSNTDTVFTVEEFKEVKNPWSVGVQLSYNLQSGVMRRDGDYPWLLEAGYIFAIGKSSTSRAYLKIGQSLRQSGIWNGEAALQLEENYSSSYSAFCLTYEESLFLKGSRTVVRPLIGGKVGFGNNLVITQSHAINKQDGGEGEIWTSTSNRQPGFMVGAYAGVNVRLFSAFEVKLALDYNYAWCAGITTSGYDESTVTNKPQGDLGIRVGLIYSI